VAVAAGEEELSRLCSIKGDYWTDASNWDVERLNEAGIRLSTMHGELQRLKWPRKPGARVRPRTA
jgi:hypothetical protein